MAEKPSIGAVFPGYDIGTDALAIRDFAQAAEDLGFERIVAYDHVLSFQQSGRADEVEAGFYDETVEFHEPLTLFAHLAAVTERISFLSGILMLPQRQTALVAKQAAEVAILSGSRLELGVGLGSTPVEFDAMGVPRGRRGARLDEQIALLRELWTQPLVDFDGKFHRVDRGAMRPSPAAPVPILIGGGSEAAFERAVRIGDGFVLMASLPPFRAGAARLIELLEAAGRPREDFAIHTMIDFGLGPEAIATELEAWTALGVDSISVRASDRDSRIFGAPRLGYTSPAQYIEALAAFAEIAA